jgi:hypothetical protein
MHEDDDSIEVLDNDDVRLKKQVSKKYFSYFS